MAQSFMSLKGGFSPRVSGARRHYLHLDRFLERYLKFWFSSKRTESRADASLDSRKQLRRSA